MNHSASEPRGELILRTVAMPANTNANGDIFGGWILSQMDIAGGILAREASRGRIVTVAVDGMKFFAPVSVGDTVCCHGGVMRTGNTSIAIALEVWVNRSYTQALGDQNRQKVTEAVFTYVAIDDDGNKRQVTSSH